MPMCNGAGEMPGQEGRDSCNELYDEWVTHHEQEILEAYQETLTISDVPDDFINNMFENAVSDLQ